MGCSWIPLLNGRCRVLATRWWRLVQIAHSSQSNPESQFSHWLAWQISLLSPLTPISHQKGRQISPLYHPQATSGGHSVAIGSQCSWPVWLYPVVTGIEAPKSPNSFCLSMWSLKIIFWLWYCGLGSSTLLRNSWSGDTYPLSLVGMLQLKNGIPLFKSLAS